MQAEMITFSFVHQNREWHFINSLQFLILQGKKLWAVKLPGSITTMEVMDHKQKSYKAIMVALTNNEVSVHVGDKETNGIFA